MIKAAYKTIFISTVFLFCEKKSFIQRLKCKAQLCRAAYRSR